MTRRHWTIVLCILGVELIVLAALLYVAFLPQRELVYEPASLELPSPPAAPDLPEVTGPFVDMPVADRRIVAQIIIDALHQYFELNGECPPYLFGGGPAIYPNLGYVGNPFECSGQGVPNPDPLISSGLLDSYPMVWPEPPLYYSGRTDDLGDSRLEDYWRCMFSTPGDHLALGEPGPILYEAIRIAKDQPSQTRKETWEELDPAVFADVRHYALGGRVQRDGKGELEELYTAWPGRDYVQTGELYRPYEPVRHCKSLPYFGYQRGEWFDASVREAWLWFYGSNVWPERNHPPPENYYGEERSNDWRWAYHELFSRFSITTERPLLGLDLLNASTGELEPDGIPDGICLLYKLRDGEVVEVVRGQGL